MSNLKYEKKILLMGLNRQIGTETIAKLLEKYGDVTELNHNQAQGIADVIMSSDALTEKVAAQLKAEKLGGETFSVFLKTGTFQVPPSRAFRREIDQFLKADSSWTILPNEGVGPLRFGMSLESAQKEMDSEFKLESWDGRFGLKEFIPRNLGEVSMVWIKEARSTFELKRKALEVLKPSLLHSRESGPLFDAFIKNAGVRLLFDKSEKLQAVGFLLSSVVPTWNGVPLLGTDSDKIHELFARTKTNLERLRNVVVDKENGITYDLNDFSLFDPTLSCGRSVTAWVFSRWFFDEFLYQKPEPPPAELDEERYHALLESKPLGQLAKPALKIQGEASADTALEHRLRKAGSKFFGGYNNGEKEKPVCTSCKQPFSLVIQIHTKDGGAYFATGTPEGAFQLRACMNPECEVEWTGTHFKKIFQAIFVSQKELSSPSNHGPFEKTGFQKLTFQKILDLPDRFPEEALHSAMDALNFTEAERTGFSAKDSRRTSPWKNGDKIGGYPAWVQSENPGRCSICKSSKNMRFFLQLQESEDEAFDFAGGLAYIHQCEKHPEQFSLEIQYT